MYVVQLIQVSSVQNVESQHQQQDGHVNAEQKIQVNSAANAGKRENNVSNYI